jgi:hypothetical protein
MKTGALDLFIQKSFIHIADTSKVVKMTVQLVSVLRLWKTVPWIEPHDICLKVLHFSPHCVLTYILPNNCAVLTDIGNK